MAAHPVAKEKINEFGLDQICERITNGETMTHIAGVIGVAIGSLLTWIEEEPERSARARESRIITARLWDERASKVIEDAPDEFELKRAKELAHHYRWRAAKIAPKDYGEKIEVESKGLPLVIVKDLSGRADEPSDD